MAQLVCTLAIACAAQFLARGSSRSLACSGSKAPTPGSAAEFHVTTVVSIYVWPVLLVEVNDGTNSVHVGYCMCGAISSSRKFQVVGVQWLEGTHPWLGRTISCHHGCIDLCLACATRGSE